ncbi:MAG: CoF synthetase [Planctomycetaceae bacterium]|nr:CoF synthetase [Planctomycetaceae bacterium]
MSEVETHPERLDRAALEALQTRRLRSLLNSIVPQNEFWKAKLDEAGIESDSISSLADLHKLPFTTKADLVADQTAHPPYGTNLTFEPLNYSRLHQTSGTTTGQPMRWLDTSDSWEWWMQCWAQIYRLVGLTTEDRLCFPFSFGPFIGFWAAFEGANRLRNLCLAGGGMSSQARLKLIADNDATFLCCTPTYALRLAEVAADDDIDLSQSSVRGLIVAGEPGGSIPAIRNRIETEWGARVFDHWGMTEIGPLAVESVGSPCSLSILESECIAEVLDPSTLEPVEPGQQGELVLTNLGRVGSPLIRYRTGDLVQVDTDPHPDGLALTRLKGGVLGRSDDMITIRGNNVFPSSIEAIIREFNSIVEFRIEVSTERAMQNVAIQIEPVESSWQQGSQELVDDLALTIKSRLNFNAKIEAVSPGTLPRFELKGKRFFRV